MDQRLIIDVSTDEVAAIRRAGVERVFEPGRHLWRMEDPPEAVYQLLEGTVKFSRVGRGGEGLTLAYRTAGTFLGFPIIHNKASHTVDAVAVDRVRALVWRGEGLDLFTGNPLIQRNALAVVTGQMHRLLTRLEDQRSASVETRLARAICKMLSEIGEERRDGALCLPVTRQELADYAGVTLYTASRTLAAWSDRGIIRPSRGRLLVADVAPISRYADAKA